MAFTITVPVESAMYKLTDDLRIMASNISGHLDYLNTEIGKRIATNSNAQLSSLNITNKLNVAYIDVTGWNRGVPYPRIVNDSDNGFGILYGPIGGPLRFATKDGTKWVSTGPIDIDEPATVYGPLPTYPYAGTPEPSGSHILNVINFRTFYKLLKDLDGRYASKTQWNQTTYDNLVAEFGRVAYKTGVNSTVEYANFAGGLRNNANQSKNVMWGITPPMSSADLAVNAGEEKVYGFAHNVGGSGTPIILVNTIFDTGTHSIIATVRAVTTTTAEVSLKNVGANAQHFRLAWIAIQG